MQALVSAPGKSILMGEHAAVYGRPALVAAIDRRLRVRMTTTPGRGVRLRLPQVGLDRTTGWSEVRAYCDRARDLWSAYHEHPDPESFRRLRGDDPAHLVQIALGEAAATVGRSADLELELDSDIPIGAGFGSSAAMAVAVFDAYLALHHRELSPAELHRRTLEVERRQHGQPSGIDHATVIHGGLIWARRTATGEMTIEPLSGTIPDGLRLFDTGTPAETTGEVVAAVRRRWEAERPRIETLLDRMAAATTTFRARLESASAAPDEVIALIRTFESCLEELGVVPPPVREIVRRIEARGGAAKVSGAGALSGHRAGSVLVYHPRAHEIATWHELDDWTPLDLRLGAAGARREASAARRQLRGTTDDP